MRKSKEMNMTQGNLYKQIIIYALPLIATNILQLLFNAADVAVLSIFAQDGDLAIAAVGSTGAIVNLVIGLFVGLSVGANVLIARCVGMQDRESAKRTVGMSVVLSVLVGIFLAVIGTIMARRFLEWTHVDAAALDKATVYLTIYFLGMPIMMLYNFAASILRAVGDTFRPLIFLVIGGVANVILNIFFVLVVGWDVEGVAIATVVSQAVSATLCIVTIAREKGYCKLEFKYMRFYKRELVDMIKIGVPAGLQGCVFSISNVIIQSTINTFGLAAMSANTITSQMEGFIYNATYSVSLSALAFVSQNYGAGNVERMRKSVRISMLYGVGIGAIMGALVMALRYQLCSIMSSDTEVLKICSEKLMILSMSYVLCGIMDVFSNAVRGLGRSTIAMLVSLAGSCLFRIIWIKFIYPYSPTLNMIFVVYPISWALTIAIFACIYFPLIKKTNKEFAESKLALSTSNQQ